MKELIILHYGNFTILGKRVKEYTQQMGCSNWAADQGFPDDYIYISIKRV